MFCTKCGGQVAINSVVCTYCGTQVKHPQNSNFNNSNFVQNQPQDFAQASAPQAQSNGLGVASMVLGILAITLTWAYGLGVVLAIPALILGIIQQKQRKCGMATAGIVLGIISIILAVLLVIFFVGFIFLMLVLFPY